MKKEIELTNQKDNYYIVRANGAGVFFGKIKERKGTEVLMENARRLYYWSGALSVTDIAKNGVTNPKDCKFTAFIDEVLIFNVVEINKCSEKSIKILVEVAEWKNQ